SSWTIRETTPPTPPRSATAARTPGAELPLKATKMRANTPTGTNAPREKTIGTGHWTSTKLLSRDTWTGAIPNTPTASTPGHVFLTSPSQREKRGQACANARRALPVLGHGACGGLGQCKADPADAFEDTIALAGAGHGRIVSDEARAGRAPRHPTPLYPASVSAKAGCPTPVFVKGKVRRLCVLDPAVERRWF